MPSNYKRISVDIDGLFEPIQVSDTPAAFTGYKINGVDLNLRYAPAPVGTASTATTGMKQAGAEIAPRFAAIGTRSTGGGGGPCVAFDMWLNSHMQAGGVQLGDEIDCAKYFPVGIEKRSVKRNTIKPAPCVRIVTTSGAAVVASDCTPMTLIDGTTCYMPDMLGKLALVDGPKGLIWERVIECRYVKTRNVVFINVDNGCYFAGENPANRIATHNSDKT